MSNPAAVQNGKAVLWGLTGFTATPASASALSGSVGSWTFYASYQPQTAKISHKFKITETMDDTGNDAALTAVNEYAEVDIELVPSAATLAAINGSSGPVFLSPLSAVTLVFANNATLAGTWIYWADAAIDLKNTDHATTSIKLRRYANSAQNAALATTINS